MLNDPPKRLPLQNVDFLSCSPFCQQLRCNPTIAHLCRPNTQNAGNLIAQLNSHHYHANTHIHVWCDKTAILPLLLNWFQHISHIPITIFKVVWNHSKTGFSDPAGMYYRAIIQYEAKCFYCGTISVRIIKVWKPTHPLWHALKLGLSRESNEINKPQLMLDNENIFEKSSPRSILLITDISKVNPNLEKYWYWQLKITYN